MPTYDYRCDDCDEVREIIHRMNDKYETCEICGGKNVTKLFTAINFHVVNGTPNYGNHGYTGKHLDLVKRRKGDKDYRDGYRNELQQQEKKGLAEFRAEQEMKKSQDTFAKMKAEGEKMTKAEKEQIKAEYGIKKGMKAGKIGL